MTNTRLTIDRYDSPAVAERFFRRTANLHLRAQRRTFVEKIQRSHPGPNILDVGCGIGRDVRYFLDQGFAATGVDGAQANLDLAHENLAIPRLNLARADVRKLPFDDAAFNGIWMVAVLGHFDNQGAQAVLKELARVSQPDAIFFSRIRKGSFYGLQPRDGTTRFYRHYQPAEIKEMMGCAGFTDILFRSARGEPTHPAKEWIHVWAAAENLRVLQRFERLGQY